MGTALAILIGLSFGATPAKAILLNVGDLNQSPDVFGTPAGVVQASQTVNGSVGGLSISIFEQVILDSGTGHLDFVYTVTNLAASTNAVERFTVSNFGTGATGTNPNQVDAGYVSNTNVKPDTVDRPGGSSGDVIGWNFSTGGGILHGQSSDVLVVKTNADAFTAGFTSTIDGQAVNLAGYQPTVVPEPSTMAIAGLGALGMIGYGLRRRKALGA